MKYLLEWEYLGYYNETFNSKDISTTLYNEIKDYWNKSGFKGLCSCQLVDEGGNIVFTLE